MRVGGLEPGGLGTSTWPTSREYAEKMLADFDEQIAYKVLRGNAIKMLELDRV